MNIINTRLCTLFEKNTCLTRIQNIDDRITITAGPC